MMKLGDVDLNNIKVSIFDFDETLAIHKDKNFTKHRSESEESFTNWYYNACFCDLQNICLLELCFRLK